ncbi:hypothetical protein CSPX01_01819 [Colletotrichum filicis]|nr:hypothetical protein CSPX01_01819 [Colletotrichum filicis]
MFRREPETLEMFLPFLGIELTCSLSVPAAGARASVGSHEKIEEDFFMRAGIGFLTQTGLDEHHLAPTAVSGGPTEGGCRRPLRRQRGVRSNQPSGGPYGLPKDGKMPPITKTVEADVDADACVLVAALGLRNAFPWPSRNPKMSSLWTAKSTPATASSGGVEFAAVIVGVTNPPVDCESDSLTRGVGCLALGNVDKQGKRTRLMMG